jgi:hypothetical protein
MFTPNLTEIELLEEQAIEAQMALARAINRTEMREMMDEGSISVTDLETTIKVLHSLVKMSDTPLSQLFMAAAEVLESNDASNQSIWSGEQLSHFFLGH